MIPYGRQDITEEDISAVVEVLRSDLVTQGPVVPRFEAAIADYCGANYAVAVNSATSALHIACLALGLGPGDRLWTSPNTFVASANCGLYCGAEIDFVDIDPYTYNMCSGALEAKLAQADHVGELPKVVVPVHFAGQSCDMRRIRELADRYGFRVLEDASHAIGGRYRGQPVGSCELSDITVFSFHPVKIITTGEGGIAVTNDTSLAHKMAMLRSHGITRNPGDMRGHSEGAWYYQQIGLGFNYRITDIQAALGLSQLQRLDEYVRLRNARARRYDAMLADLQITRPYCDPASYSSFHLYVVRVKGDRRSLFDQMRLAGVGVNVHYIPVYTHPYYQDRGFGTSGFPETERYYAHALSLPLFPRMTDSEQDVVVESLISNLE